MPDWAKVLMGCFALMLGASAPTAIVAVLNPGDLVALNPPSPGGRELRNPPEPKVNGDQKKAAASQSSTTPTVPSHASQVGRYSQQNTSQGNENAPPDWWLDWFTAGLVIVGLFQLVVFGYQAKKLRKSIDLTREISGRQERDMRLLLLKLPAPPSLCVMLPMQPEKVQRLQNSKRKLCSEFNSSFGNNQH